MSTRAPLGDGSVTEQMLVPHLRRKRGQRGLALVYDATGAGSAGAGVIVQYRTSASQAVTVGDCCRAIMRLVAPVAVVSDAGVSATPWRWTTASDYDADVDIVAAVDLTKFERAVLALRVNGRDALTSVCSRADGVDLRGALYVRSQDTVTMELRASNDTGRAVVLNVTSLTVKFTARS